MFIESDDKDVSALSHGEDTFEPDAKGRFDVPADVAAAITGRPGWSVSEDQSEDKPAPKKTTAKTAAKSK